MTAETPDSLAGRPWSLAALWLALLGPMFFAVYGGCNAFTSHGAVVGSFFFDWERHIPFVSVMIVPYLSIDLFFAGSFFLCRDKVTLRSHALRILIAIIISALGFLLFPLRFGWARPAVHGWLGALFAPLNAFDQPYNLCPSLHISLGAILWRVYSRSTRGRPWLWSVAGTWFALIGVSTLLVYQHHVIDLLGGYLVARLCFAVVREKTAEEKRPAQQHLDSPCLPPSFTKAPPPSWPLWSSSSPGTACAGSAAGPTSANASISPTTPAIWTLSSSGPPCGRMSAH